MTKKRAKKIEVQVNSINEGIWKIKKENKEEKTIIESSFSVVGFLDELKFSLSVKGDKEELQTLKKYLRINGLKDKLHISVFPNEQTSLTEFEFKDESE